MMECLNLLDKVRATADTEDELREVVDHYELEGFTMVSCQRQSSGEYVCIFERSEN